MANNIKLNNPAGTPLQKPQGTGFVNLNKVLQANVGNRLGETVASGLGQQAQQVQQGIGQLGTDFSQKASASNLATSQNKQAVSDALKNIVSGQPVQMGSGSKQIVTGQPGVPGQLSTGRVDFGLNPGMPNAPTPLVSDDQVKQFGTFLSGQYSGPKDLDPTKLAQIGSKAQEVQDLGQGLQSGQDKTRLLQTFAAKGPYTSGQSKLDSLLLGQGPQAKQKLAEARQQTKGLTQQLGREQTVAQELGQAQQNQAQQFGKETAAALSKAQTDISTPLEKQATDYQMAQAAKAQGLQNILKNLGSTIDPEEAAALGLTGQYSKNTFGYKPGDNLVQTPIQAAAMNVASPEQRAQLLALSQLSGQDAPVFGEQYDPNKAAQVDAQKFEQGVGAQQAAYQHELKNILQQYQGSSPTVINSQLGGLNRKYGLPDNYSPGLMPGGVASNPSTATPTQKDAQKRNRARFL